MYRDLFQVRARIFGTPLLIAPHKLEALLGGLHEAMSQRGSRLADGERSGGEPGESSPLLLAEPFASPEPQIGEDGERPRGYAINRGVATVPVHGVLVRRHGRVSPDSTPLQSYERLTQTFRSAHRDSRVRGILMHLDSPGGEAGGVFELAELIAELSRNSGKPTWAIANEDALSAGYALASAAGRVYATRTAALGSIGVVALHADQSEYDRQQGIHYTYLFRGDRKIDANPHEPLSPEARLEIQAEVDRINEMFIDHTARGRLLDAGELRAMKAGIFYGPWALKRGLADRLGTAEETHAALAEYVKPKPRGAAQMDDAPAPTPAPDNTALEAPATNVVPLAAVQAATARAKEIADLCNLAGFPELISEHIGLNTEPAALVAILQSRKAAAAAARPVTAIDTSRTAERTKIASSQEIAQAAVARFEAQSRAYHRGD